ncbi:uncharacterized protein CXQ87_005326 [Candidozyma duobushaemuli]|uniref:Glycoside hydrolase family 5 C-terminal domain-containing protein n=2 Tax=Candidozyma TaxID=3303203 RepID=A0ABX8I9C4_9ASCO|nr:uncharacterized protein CXQ87_005326 [[Candida] duobushaemulonis]PVH15047.1 hypothetical protein CXQ87_005326 [[Candida] duobushaemulonis]QWU89886.1 hypothetical protein CA3LBN_004244 [[Candida] haemuloni]
MNTDQEILSNTLSFYDPGPDFSETGVKPLRVQADASKPIPAAENASSSILPCEKLKIVDGNFVDSSGRKRVLKGINVDNSMKLPVTPFSPSCGGNYSDSSNIFFEGDTVSFVGRPFPLEQAEEHWKRIKSWGYNVARYVLTWEAIEHEGPGKYDDDFVNYTIEMLKIVHKVGGIFVFLESHQDVWSRYSGGSGAPLWTFYAAGLQPLNFSATEAAICHNDARFEKPTDSECYPRMFWPTNYNRLASLTMFTMFFAGKVYFPHLEIDGVNIQTYLQSRHRDALAYLTKRVTESLPELVQDGTISGFESLNEPHMGLIGNPDLGKISEVQRIRLGTTPTFYQSVLLGMGLPVEVETYLIDLSGPVKQGTQIVDPKGKKAWLSAEEFAKYDTHYGWKRSGWTPGECIYSGLKIWEWSRAYDLDKINTLPLDTRLEFSTTQCRLLQPGYFNDVSKLSAYLGGKAPPKSLDMEFFLANFFVDFYLDYKQSVRKINKDYLMLIQPPIFTPPPIIGKDDRGVIDDKTVYAPHYYDIMTLLLKNWNEHFNSDSLGISRGQYAHPSLGVVVGDKAIRNCISKQLKFIVQEGKQRLGHIPALLTETGIPFDMNNKKAFEDYKYTLQTTALDTIANGLEQSGLHHTYWSYCVINSHEYGDYWDNEDFAFWSPEDQGKNLGKGESFEECIKNCYPSEDVVRAPSAVIRIFLVSYKGEVKAVEFDIKKSKYSLSLDLNGQSGLSKAPTVIYVPKWHFPDLSYNDIYATSGDVKYNEKLEYLEWHHPEGAGTETIIIKKYTGKMDDVTKREESHAFCTIV